MNKAVIAVEKNSGADNLKAKNNTFTKKIASTTYEVSIHFSKTSSENMNDKIMRLVKNEALSQ